MSQEYVWFEKANGDSIAIPVCEEDNVKWYPISFISQKVLDREKVTSTMLKKKYNDYLSKKEFMYHGGTNYIETNSLNHEGLAEWIKGMKIARMNDDQKKNLNKFCEMLDIDYKVETRELLVDKLDKNDFKSYSEYDIECHGSIVGEFDKYKLCTTCQNYYPMHDNFYNKDERNKSGYGTVCKKCSNVQVGSKKDVEYKIYKKYGEKEFLKYNTKKNLGDFESGDIYRKEFKSKENELRWIKYLVDCGKLREINTKTIKESLPYAVSINSIQEIYEYLYDIEELRSKIFKYKGYRLGKTTKEEDYAIVMNYLDYIGIDLNEIDVFKFDYFNTLSGCGIFKKYSRSHIELVMMIYDYKYPAYKFKGGHKNYWKVKENRIKELKWLIENELNIDNIDKLPLHLTKGSINSISRTMYNVMKKYYTSLFEWVDECYPNKFKPYEFDIGYRRDMFDSIEEQNAHEILKEKFGNNLYYNSGDASNRITIIGHQPDWFVLNEKSIIIEYFGLYVINRTNNKRVASYIEKTNKKIKDYTSLEYYDKIYIYPDDLKDNFRGLKDKLSDY